jgi:hypothetical protein
MSLYRVKKPIMPYKDLKELVEKDALIKAVLEDRQRWIDFMLNKWPFKLGKKNEKT